MSSKLNLEMIIKHKFIKPIVDDYINFQYIAKIWGLCSVSVQEGDTVHTLRTGRTYFQNRLWS